MHEPLLALEHRAALLGACLGDIERIVAAAGVPHHQQHDQDQQRAAAQMIVCQSGQATIAA